MALNLTVLPSIPTPPSSPPSAEAGGGFPADAPGSAYVHVFDTDCGPHLFLPNGSMIFGVAPATADALRDTAANAEATLRHLRDLGLALPPRIDNHPPTVMPMRSVSLAIAQKCNLSCSYCYAQEGDFGSTPQDMPREVALAAIERLIRDAGSGERISVAFLGGEPLSNRATLRAATEHAAVLARERGVEVAFSVTTNGTLLDSDDADFFERHGFAVTVSIDGIGEEHDRLRPTKGGRGTFREILSRVRPLLSAQHRMQVSARATVTPHNLALRRTLDQLIDMGFASVGFSPVLASPSGRGEMDGNALREMLAAMIECGEEFKRSVITSRRYPFLNMMNALREIHRGTHRPYPCGAGASYFGVAADGKLFACHRFIGDDFAAMGDVLTGGVDDAQQYAWLVSRHVHRQQPCSSCWARYLCGGGCHHEVIRRGRVACEYIRGWLQYCLGAYVSLLARRPDYFDPAVPRTASSAERGGSADPARSADA